MPTLPGFLTLKKKKTREGNTDSSPPSNPTSPVTPATTKAIDQQSAPLSAPQPVAAQASPLAATVGRQDTQPQAAASPAMDPFPLQPPYSPPQHTPSPGTALGPQ